jgi:antitoxin MazE
MNSTIRKIGNSKGIVLPLAFLAEFKLEKDSDVEIELMSDGILIKPIGIPRKGWEQTFKDAMSKVDEPENDLYEGMSNDFDSEEWSW